MSDGQESAGYCMRIYWLGRCRVVLESHEMRTVATQTAHLGREKVVFCQLISAEECM